MTKRASIGEVNALFRKNFLEPIGTYVNSQTPLECICMKCGNTVFPRYDKVSLRGHQCGYCAGRKGADIRAYELVKKLGHTPLEPYKNALHKWKMRCGTCDKIISPKFNSLQQGGYGCQSCTTKRSGKKRRELGEQAALIILKKFHITPLETYPGTHTPWKGRCQKCDSLVQPRLSGLKAGQGGCIKCGIKRRAIKRMLTDAEARVFATQKRLRPLEPYPGSSRKWLCQCLRCERETSITLGNIKTSKFGCPWCARTVVDAQEARDKMLKASLQPLVAYPGSDVGWLCRCLKCNREVTPTYGGIRYGQGGCKWCKPRNPHIDPASAVEFFLKNSLQPLVPFPGAKSKWKSRCLRCLETVFPQYSDVKQGSKGCKYCAPNFVNIAKILRTVDQAGFTPLEPYKNSHAKWKVQHKKCQRIFSTGYNSIRAGHGCRYCAGVAVVGEEAVKIMLDAGLQPLTKYSASKKGWKSKCLVCNKIVFPHFTSVKNRGSGCIYCSGSKVDAKDAVAFFKSRDLAPLIPFPGARKPWKSRCLKCDRVVSPQYSSVKSGQGSCRFCTDWGINYAGPGFIYLMTHHKLQSHKIGIGGAERSRNRDRTQQHLKRGWVLYKKLSFPLADQAFQVEQMVLVWLRKEKNLPVFLSEFELPQGGYSETVDASEIDLSTIWRKIEQIAKQFARDSA